MSTSRPGHKMGFAGLFTAAVASLCCITPVLALFSGAAGIASSFSWLEPYRPYLMGITVLALAYSWYLVAKKKKDEQSCACDAEKPSFLQSKKFLGMITLAALVLMAFPWYAPVLYLREEHKGIVITDTNHISQMRFHIAGMSCATCTVSINQALSKAKGVLAYKTEYDSASSLVKFDRNQLTADSIIRMINENGYTVTRTEK